jgi:predicted transcriptional regulator
VPIVLESGRLNLLEPSGPVQACNGIAVPLPVLCGMYQFSCIEPYQQSDLIKREAYLLNDMAVPDDSNFYTKETENVNKYKDLEIKASRM